MSVVLVGGLLDVDEHVERLVVDDDGLGGVGALGAVSVRTAATGSPT